MKVNYIYLAFVLAFSTNFIIADDNAVPVKVEAENKTTEVKEESADKKDKGKDKKKKPETVAEFIEEEELKQIDGFLTLLHDEEKDKYYLVLESSELNKEFIYFPYLLNGPQAAGAGGGAIGDAAILEFRTFKDDLGSVSYTHLTLPTKA